MKNLLKNLLFGGPGAGSVIGDFGLAILRIGIGLMMALGHGYGKVFHDGALGPPQMLVDGVTAMGFPAPYAFAWCAALAEFAGALLLAVGLFTRPAALALTFNMGVAAFVVHRADPLFMTGQGASKEPALLFLLPFVFLLFAGAGRFSLDRLIGGRDVARDLELREP
jgi:putative oxidoreductase